MFKSSYTSNWCQLSCLTAVLLFFFAACRHLETADDQESINTIDTAGVVKPDQKEIPVEPNNADTFVPVKSEEMSEIERKCLQAGLIDVRLKEPGIMVEMRYSTANNFLGKDVYHGFNKVYLQPDVADKLILAQMFLKSRFPSYNLLVYDAARPRSVQQKMWDILDVPVKEKIKFLSNPKYGSLHNFGAAVDLTIADQFGEELDMGTDFDHFGELAYPVKEKELLEKGELTEEQVSNRKLLREVMGNAGFFNIQTEWWHFNSCYRKEALKKYSMIE